MSAEKSGVESSRWLKSPVSEKNERLRHMSEVVCQPYHGKKRKLRLVRTAYVIGSSQDCDIRVNDPFVCAHHAQLRLRENGEGFEVFDLDSRNGVFLNGLRIGRAILPASGVLRIGRSSFSWSEGSKPDLESSHWVFADPFMQQTVERLRQVANSKLSVLLLGETGTGKEILARLLHQWSGRAEESYVVINGSHTGGALADSELFGHEKGSYTGSDKGRVGALRSAHRGTLFLDEVADIPSTAQVKLLRALESGEVKALGSDEAQIADFRLVSATSQNIEMKIQDGAFRLDLYYRIAGVTVFVPPLRERPLDILAIAKKNLSVRGFDLDKECEGKLLSYPWPGNVRELCSVLERAMLVAQAESSSRVLPFHIELAARSPQVKKREFLPQTLTQLEREWIQTSLERNGWSRSIVAQELGIARSTLFQKMRRYCIRDRAVVEADVMHRAAVACEDS